MGCFKLLWCSQESKPNKLRMQYFYIWSSISSNNCSDFCWLSIQKLISEQKERYSFILVIANLYSLIELTSN